MGLIFALTPWHRRLHRLCVGCTVWSRPNYLPFEQEQGLGYPWVFGEKGGKGAAQSGIGAFVRLRQEIQGAGKPEGAPA